jgi:RNA polymerase sigma-70 factor (ECF subfamily)
LAELDDERACVERAASGDAAAIGELYRRHAPAIFRYLFYRLGDRERAEDLASEVFVRALEALPRYRRQGRPFSAWLYRIASARVADYYRRHRRRPTVPLAADLPARGGDPGEVAESRLTAELLQQVIARLSPLQQQVIVLRFLEGLSHAEVAQVIGRSEGAVRVLQFRALEALRRLLERER